MHIPVWWAHYSLSTSTVVLEIYIILKTLADFNTIRLLLETGRSYIEKLRMSYLRIWRRNCAPKSERYRKWIATVSLWPNLMRTRKVYLLQLLRNRPDNLLFSGHWAKPGPVLLETRPNSHQHDRTKLTTSFCGSLFAAQLPSLSSTMAFSGILLPACKHSIFWVSYFTDWNNVLVCHHIKFQTVLPSWHHILLQKPHLWPKSYLHIWWRSFI